MVEQFPEDARQVIEVLAEVYKIEATCRDEAFSPEQRLAFHQEHSEPLMKELHDWMTEQFEQHLVEPNSGLGGALRYLIRHWEPLTLVLRQAGAPLDNSVCERALRRAILHRKGSMFSKTPNGAEVGVGPRWAMST